ncbi:MAG: hypothetical protein SGBAC_002079 [Bacillariaceae sp.]
MEFAVSDTRADGMAITAAFRHASDDDVRNVMNAMSDPTDVDSLKFYIVPSSWFVKAWRLLGARSEDDIDAKWRDSIGSIHNSELLNIEHEVTSDEEDPAEDQQKKDFEKLHLIMAKNRKEGKMKNGLEHTKDYFFLGASAWLLVKEKFGFDGYELERPCVANAGNSSLEIQLKLEESNGTTPKLIEIPPSGRFAYEKVMSNKVNKTVAIISEGNIGSASNISNVTTSSQGAIIPFTPNAQSNDNCANEPESSNDQEMETDSQPMAGRKRHASGLGNLGNTCFMNSTLQCLAHTEPLMQYFLSGEYVADLNNDNPLGTGGELASEFANLIREMWGIPIKRHGVVNASSLSAVYPRQFKQCVGTHAEQFMGYDQHDSQEFATYLLDALHEDTNRVTKKPYIEKPEQGKDEADDEAANKSWELHLKREDSRVLENFMGQVKSRLECSEANCDRVSTTFDPFMYLSVPIPGESDRQLKVTFVPLKPNEIPRYFDLTVPKTAAMGKVFSMLNDELIELGARSDPIPLHDFVAVDIWSHEIFGWYQLDSDIDRIRESDKTFVFELDPQHAVTEESKKRSAEPDEIETSLVSERGRVNLDVETLTRLNKDDNWQSEIENYVKVSHTVYILFNEKRGTVDDRLQFYNKLKKFLDQCQKEVEQFESSPKTAVVNDDEEMKEGGGDDDDGDSDGKLSANAGEIQGLIDRTDASPTFTNVKTKRDVEILGFCANKIRQLILKLINDKKNKYNDGITIQVSMRKHKTAYSSSTKLATPIALRIPSTMTVYGLRKELAKRLSRSLRSDLKERGKDTVESAATTEEKISPMNDDHSFGSPELSILRQVPMSFDRKDGSSYGGTRSTYNSKQLGMLEKTHNGEGIMANPTDDAEMAYVADILGPSGNVTLEWPGDLFDQCFDEVEYENVEDSAIEEDAKKKGEKVVTNVSDCIEKYCQMEQLEETEMWYCNQCQKHVRAWKQFHLYRAPPILIIHLKRFHYSARTHRRDKITSFIDFQLKGLDLTKMVASYTEAGKPIYDCYAVSNHYGGLGGGHYTAHILDDDGQWYYYDDSRMTKAEEKEVLTEAAYVLYYRRQDVPLGQNIAFPTPEPVPSLAPAPAAIESEPANAMANDESDLSSNISTFGVVADDEDDMAVDGDSKAESSPVESMDAEIDIAGFTNEDFPPLQ